jgi:hypothetical protein
MLRIDRSLAVLASTLLLLSACQSPPSHRPSPWGLKTIHPQAGRCGHFPRAQPVTETTGQAELQPAAPSSS